MKKILMSVMVIAVTIGVVATGLSGAWFSDTESTAGNPGGPDSTGANYLIAGSIDLDPIEGTVAIPDLKPCMTGWGAITLHNNGMNDGNAWLHFTNVIGLENGTVDAEEEAYLARSGYDPDALRYDNDLERFITVDVWVDPPEGTSDTDGVPTTGGSYVIHQDDHWKLADLECQWIPLGELKYCDYVEVWLSFHIQDEAGNQYQTDEVTFDIEVMLQQLNAPAPDNEWPSDMRVLRLENKNPWAPIIDDGIYGILTYDRTHNPFNYTLNAYGLSPDGEYKLIYYADPWPGDGMTHSTGVLIGVFTANTYGDILAASGSQALGTVLPNSDDWNYPDGAKLWLIPSSCYSAGTPGTQGQVTCWPPDDNWLFEMRLITYE